MNTQPESHTTLYDACQEILQLEEVQKELRLIAAAPELFEALEAILENDGGEGSKCFNAIRLFEARERGKVALAKAKGETE
jgi:hypothetical protein